MRSPYFMEYVWSFVFLPYHLSKIDDPIAEYEPTKCKYSQFTCNWKLLTFATTTSVTTKLFGVYYHR